MFGYFGKLIFGKLAWIVAGTIGLSLAYGTVWMVKKKIPEMKYKKELKEGLQELTSCYFKAVTEQDYIDCENKIKNDKK